MAKSKRKFYTFPEWPGYECSATSERLARQCVASAAANGSERGFIRTDYSAADCWRVEPQTVKDGE